MPEKKFTISQIKEITGASRNKDVHIPSYYAPPFLDELRNRLKSHLLSTGGRPTIEGADIVRKVRFSKGGWHKLRLIAKKWSQNDVAVSPAQVASSIVEGIIFRSRIQRKKVNKY